MFQLSAEIIETDTGILRRPRRGMALVTDSQRFIYLFFLPELLYNLKSSYFLYILEHVLPHWPAGYRLCQAVTSRLFTM